MAPVVLPRDNPQRRQQITENVCRWVRMKKQYVWQGELSEVYFSTNCHWLSPSLLFYFQINQRGSSCPFFRNVCLYWTSSSPLGLSHVRACYKRKSEANARGGSLLPHAFSSLARSLARNHAWPRDSSSLFLYSPSKLLLLRSHFLSWLLLITIVVVFATRSTWNWLHGVLWILFSFFVAHF